MNRRERPRVSRVQELQQVKSLCPSYLTQQDSVRPMSETGLEKFTDGHCREVVLGQASLEPDEIRCANLNFRGVFDYENAFMDWNEIGKDIEQSCLAGSGPARDEDVLAVDDRNPQHVGEFL